ncbi:uncharacterized protein LOC143137498 isoform X3 [Alosa pseudoharengus]|uniref:uncharacterized protein LOC143137498 isoform X3 n=1 Tax=Alosa pseudoharengus TaxID=34774 RepID=UPI003F89AC80
MVVTLRAPMDPLNFLTQEQLLLFFRLKKTEMSCMDQPHTFLTQLRDHDLVSEKLYQRVVRMKTKEQKKKGVYEVLDSLETNQPECVETFWRSVFTDHIMQLYPTLRLLRNSLMDGSFSFNESHPEMDSTSKVKDAEGKNEDMKERKVKKRSRQKSKGSTSEREEEEEQDQAGTSQVKTSVKKRKLQKPIYGSPLIKGGGEDIWNWPMFKTQLPVTCGNKEGTLYRDKLAKGVRCIFHEDRWYTPGEFEKLGGKERSKNWKTSIRCRNTPLQKLIQENHLTSSSAKRRSADRGQDGTCMQQFTNTDPTHVKKKMRRALFPSSPENSIRRSVLPVQCGPVTGRLQKDRFASGSTGKCIRTDERWLTPAEFIRLNPDLKDGMWKRDITCRGQPLSYLLQGKILQVHSLLCMCRMCSHTESDLEDQTNDDHCFICGERGELLCCDGCPRSFHRDCHIPTPTPSPCDDWLCTFCVWKRSQEWRYADHMTQKQVLDSRISDYTLQCQYLLLFLLNADEQRIFTTDPRPIVSGYSSVIPRPMWLQKVRENLESCYHLVGEFVSDVRLIFRNCAVFNRNNQEIKEMGIRLSTLFEEEFQNTFIETNQPTPTPSPVVREEHQCESCAEVPDSGNWNPVAPEVSTEKSVSTYSLSSPAGSYECPESGLRWTCVGPVTLQYRFIDWHLLADELPNMQYRPAGPSMDIKLISGDLEEIHLPHFLCLGGSQSFLKDAVEVLHKQDSGVFIEKCELSRFHARLVKPSFSLLGPFYSLMSLFFPGKEDEREKHMKIHADVQVYQCRTVPLTFRTYLLPEDAQLRKLLEDQEERFRGHMLFKPRPVKPLQMNEFYALQTDCDSTINPVELDLRYSSIAPNFFEVSIRQASEFSMELLSCADQQRIWQAGVKKTECCLDNPDQSGDNSSAADFLKRHHANLVDKVKNVNAIADQMFSKGHVSKENYDKIWKSKLEQDKMRLMLDCCGASAQGALLSILQRDCPDLMEELG